MPCAAQLVPLRPGSRARYALPYLPRFNKIDAHVRVIGSCHLFGYDQSVKELAEPLELPADERLQLVEAIWDSLIEVPEAVPISDDVLDELDRRLMAYYDDPSSARPWREIKEALFRSK